MRRLSARLTVVAAAVWLAAVPAVGTVGTERAAAAQPSPTPGATQEAAPPEVVPGEEVCTVSDQRLVELSGMVAFDDGYAVLNDGTQLGEREGVFFLDQGCQVTDQIGYPTPPLDPEELAWDRDANALWVGDTGDNFELTGQEPRASAALWRIELEGDRTPVIHRFSYPDGQPRDAEALVLDESGTPVIVTKTVGAAELFVPTELRPSSGPDDLVPLEAAGEVSLPEPETDIQHRLGPVARQVVTGGANAPDGSAVVLRSYTDAFEFEVADGDVVAALTGGQPQITPLPDEPQGEAIAYSPDGERFLTVSEVPEGDDSGYTPTILGYTPVAPPEPEPTASGAPPAATGGGGGGLFNDLQDFINVIAAVGVIGLLLVGAGVFGIIRARRAGAAGAAAAAGGPGGGPGGGNAPVTGRARLPGFEASAPPGAAGPHPGAPGPPSGPPGSESPPGVYTSSAARPSGTEYRGTEYGGGGGYPAEYGGPEPDGNGYPAGGYQEPGGYGGGGGYDRGGGYGGADYPRDQGYAGADYRQADYGPAGYAPAGYDQPAYDQPGYEYGPAGYPEGYREPYEQEWPNGNAGAQPNGADYYSRDNAGYSRDNAEYSRDDAGYSSPDKTGHYPDDSGYYSDDPDYPYEFRGRER